MAEKKKTFAIKLAEFIQEVPVIFKASKGYSYQFANWTSILGIVNPLMKKYKLGFTQGTKIIDGNNAVWTKVYDAENCANYEYSEITIPSNVTLKGQSAPQVMGSLITYFKRYQLSAMLGLVTDSDNDAAEAPKTAMKAKTQNFKEENKVDNVLKTLDDKTMGVMLDYIDKGKVELVKKKIIDYKESDNKYAVQEKLKSLK